MISASRWFRQSGDPSKPGTPVAAWGGWRRLGLFWAVVVGLIAVVGSTAQLIGPSTRSVTTPANVADAPKPPETPIAASKPPPPTPVPKPNATDAEAQLYERAPRGIDGYLPRIAPDGRPPMRAFAATPNRQAQGPKVGLIVAGIGMNEADSLAAARTLQGGVTFALSPYAANPARMVTEIRNRGHEVLISVPMEPVEFPLSDPGPRALMTHLSPKENLERLHWVMTRAGGYVGMTNALGAMRGERFSSMGDQMTAMLRELGRRGLLFVDARPDAERNHLSWHRSVDLVVDEIATEERIDQRLELLSRLARDRGAALGLATQPRSVTIDRIAAWTTSLADKGIVLTPITAIAQAPAGLEDTK